LHRRGKNKGNALEEGGVRRAPKLEGAKKKDKRKKKKEKKKTKKKEKPRTKKYSNLPFSKWPYVSKENNFRVWRLHLNKWLH
jgi:hypothetical protein